MLHQSRYLQVNTKLSCFIFSNSSQKSANLHFSCFPTSFLNRWTEMQFIAEGRTVAIGGDRGAVLLGPWQMEEVNTSNNFVAGFM